MNKILYITILFCLLPLQKMRGQSEVAADSISYENNPFDFEKTADGYLLDQDLLMIAPAPVLPSIIKPGYGYGKYGLESMNLNKKFEWNSNLIFNKEPYFSVSHLHVSPLYRSGSNISLQSATYKLKNGLRITTYGEYDADGYRRQNPSALPWEKNDFHGAFEIKSESGKFGVRIGVQKY